MMGHPRVIGYLQRSVSHEFNAAQQYTLQAVHAESWGMKDLARRLRGDAREELEHAEAFIGQLLRLGVTPYTAQPRAPRVGRTHVELVRFGMETEEEAMRLYDEAARFCEQIGDAANAAVFSRILADEVNHFQQLEREWQALTAKRA